MLDTVSFALLGFIQGLTEFLPVSSTGHLILARELWNISSAHGLAIDAVLQLATAFAVVAYFFKDLIRLLVPSERATLIAILVGTIPAIIAGLYLEEVMTTLFRSATLVAYALIAGSVIMLAAEYTPRRFRFSSPWLRGLFIGFFQALALIPGMSRSGMTIAGGMFAGLSRSDAARFSFILSVPILLGSGGKKLYELISLGVTDALGVPLIIGALVAFSAGLAAIHFLLIIVRNTPLTIFVFYRLLLAALILALLS